MINLPQSTDQLRNIIKTAIEFYQGSPVKNENKLNESLAQSLGFKNYDQLAAIIKTSTPIETYDIEFDYSGEQTLIINGIRIDTQLAHEEIVSHTVVEREDRIVDLCQYIAEAQHDPRREYDVILMKEDLETLNKSKAEWVLEAVGTNGFIAPDLEPELFNKTCDEMLEAAAAHYQEIAGAPQKSSRLIENAYTYYGDDPVTDVHVSELVLIKETFLRDEKLPIGMMIEKFQGEVPEDYVAAYPSSTGEYVPIEFEGEPMSADD